MVQEEAEQIRARIQLLRAFTPGAPVNRKEFFAGRLKQLSQVLQAVSQPGQHAVVFGERGVGKTSLAGLVHAFWEEAAKDFVLAVRINCNPQDGFGTIWAKVAEEMSVLLEKRNFPGVTTAFRDAVDRLVNGEATPNLVRRCFQLSDHVSIIVLDEFDRLEDRDALGLIADTIKALSDHWVLNVTLVLVGVADAVDDLIEEHASIDRALAQVLVPRMARAEVSQIVTKGLDSVGMTIKPSALNTITELSQGLPYYAHLLGLQSATTALSDKQMEVGDNHVVGGVLEALDNAVESIIAAYHQATISPRRDSLYKQVLLSCALAPVDDLGYFAPADIARPLSKVMKKTYRIPAFIRHLSELTKETHGKVLQKTGAPHKQRYRFTNPLLKPFVVMKSIQDKLISPEHLFGV
ncbi:MAG: orc1/cdc6 family replication initiation protein [Chloroflexi bacterium]|nr:orc1/cdc6 family replication initiation protein [Chloroflexota bacterium]